MDAAIQSLVSRTPFIDTHEHLIEERRRLAKPDASDGRFPCDDWAYLFLHYSSNDLVSAGQPAAEARKFFGQELSPCEKWRLFAPVYERTRNTGYIMAVQRAVRILYGVDEIAEHTVERITEKMRAKVRPGFYYDLLRGAGNIESAQVNNIDTNAAFGETAQPDLLYQDLSFVRLGTQIDLKLAEPTGIEPSSLENWHQVIAWYFEKYGRRAIAVKNQSAYARRLDYARVNAAEARPLFARLARGEKLAAPEMKALQDHLFHHCVERATEAKLPIKLHTGYYAGANRMPLERLRQNASDLCPILLAHPQAKFVLMHIGYPYQDEYIALAKHFTNAYVDLCWAWIINPAASVRFLKEALVAAPMSKFFGFGGDYFNVEPIVGHADMARQGIAQALSELVEEHWLSEKDALAAAERVMHRNAREVFDLKGTLAAWSR